MRRIQSVLLVCVALACGDGSVLAPGEVLPVVSLSGENDEGASRMTVTVSNIGNGDFHFGGCALSIERNEGDAWVTIPEYRNQVCLAFLEGLPAGSARSFSVPRPTERGLYRVRFMVRKNDRELPAFSARFFVGIGFGANLQAASAAEVRPTPQGATSQ